MFRAAAPVSSRPRFQRYVGVDYSGAGTAFDRLSGIRVFEAHWMASGWLGTPREVRRAGGNWSRATLHSWLLDRLSESLYDGPLLIGIDHAFSFPLVYAQTHQLPPDWEICLHDFHTHWPTDQRGVRVEDVRRGLVGAGGLRTGDARWRRLAEQRNGRAKSIFHFDVPGSVAKSTHAGLPWLWRLRHEFGPRVHVWPFDGWRPRRGRSVVAEVYPSLWSGQFPRRARGPDQHDAYAVAAWLSRADASGELEACFVPKLSPEEREVAHFEGWILGL